MNNKEKYKFLFERLRGQLKYGDKQEVITLLNEELDELWDSFSYREQEQMRNWAASENVDD